MGHKVVYHIGESIDAKTKTASGNLIFGDAAFRIEGHGPAVEVPFISMEQVELFWLYGLGRMIKIKCHDRTLYLTVVRFNIGGLIAVENFAKTGQLYDVLSIAGGQTGVRTT